MRNTATNNASAAIGRRPRRGTLFVASVAATVSLLACGCAAPLGMLSSATPGEQASAMPEFTEMAIDEHLVLLSENGESYPEEGTAPEGAVEVPVPESAVCTKSSSEIVAPAADPAHPSSQVAVFHSAAEMRAAIPGLSEEGAASSVDLPRLLGGFDDAFFQESDLVCAFCSVGTGSASVSIDKAYDAEGTYSVLLRESVPHGAVTCDVAYWTAFVPVVKAQPGSEAPGREGPISEAIGGSAIGKTTESEGSSGKGQEDGSSGDAGPQDQESQSQGSQDGDSNDAGAAGAQDSEPESAQNDSSDEEGQAEDAARQEAEQRAAALHVEALHYAFDLPDDLYGKVDIQIDGDSVNVYGTELTDCASTPILSVSITTGANATDLWLSNNAVVADVNGGSAVIAYSIREETSIPATLYADKDLWMSLHNECADALKNTIQVYELGQAG